MYLPDTHHATTVPQGSTRDLSIFKSALHSSQEKANASLPVAVMMTKGASSAGDIAPAAQNQTVESSSNQTSRGAILRGLKGDVKTLQRWLVQPH